MAADQQSLISLQTLWDGIQQIKTEMLAHLDSKVDPIQTKLSSIQVSLDTLGDHVHWSTVSEQMRMILKISAHWPESYLRTMPTCWTRSRTLRIEAEPLISALLGSLNSRRAVTSWASCPSWFHSYSGRKTFALPRPLNGLTGRLLSATTTELVQDPSWLNSSNSKIRWKSSVLPERRKSWCFKVIPYTYILTSVPN